MQLTDLAKISTDVWKLNRALTKAFGDYQDLPLRLRVPIMDIQKVLETVGLETVDLTGRTYDRGFSVEVASYASGVSEDAEKLVIVDMLSPIVMLEGRVLMIGEVVLGTKK